MKLLRRREVMNAIFSSMNIHGSQQIVDVISHAQTETRERVWSDKENRKLIRPIQAIKGFETFR